VSYDESDNYTNLITCHAVTAQDVQKWLAGFKRKAPYLVTQQAHEDRNDPLSKVVFGFLFCHVFIFHPLMLQPQCVVEDDMDLQSDFCTSLK
jgi:hypothetical protein